MDYRIAKFLNEINQSITALTTVILQDIMTVMYTRSLSIQNSSFLLLGPRGTGKSTWLKTHFPKKKLINLLDEAKYQAYLEDISLFYKELEPLESGSWVVVDEIQRMPNLLNEVHRLMEEKKLKFALTGSSARKLKRAGVNLLAGRANQITMFPLSPKELANDFLIDKVLSLGGLPLVWDSENPERTLKSYVQMYLREEIKAEALVRNLPGFARFLPVMALYHGQVLNVSTTARDAGISRTTVQGFIEILEDTLILEKLSAYRAGIRVREKKHPKVYWVDPGMVRSAKKLSGSPSPEEKGALFEGYLFTCLRMAMEYHGEIQEINYWASSTAKSVEVDFLLTTQKGLIAVEAKATTRLRKDHFRGLEAISELKDVKARILIYLGEQNYRHEGIDVMSFKSFSERWLV